MKKLILISLLLFLSEIIFAQNKNKPTSKSLIITYDSVVIDSLSIIPKSVTLKTKEKEIISSENYKVDFAKSLLIIDSRKYDTLKISYKTFDINFSKPHYHKKFDSIFLSENKVLPYKYEVENKQSNNFFTNSDIKKSGSISRGITMGNNQDASVSSDLNLQLSGKITNDISVVAAISDDNIPVQADGTTQNLREFDKVFIQVSTKQTKLTAGDFEIKKPVGYFLNLHKKVQGGQLETERFFKKSKYFKSIKSSISGAVAKGKYNRMKIPGQEANQGPYKLTGANNEVYIMVLSGSEKVYIDGELLKRGNEFDYTINYNSAELTFTTNQLITKDKRIIIEFEYSNRNYVRFSCFSENNLKTTSGNFYVNYFLESDAKNQTIQQELSENNKLLLHEVGDNLQNAVISSAVKIDTFSNNEVLYRKTDTIVDNAMFQDVYVYSVDENNANYRVSFSYLGKNKGNYERIKSSANGKVYKWVSPVNNIPQGEYEPVTLLVSPKSKQILSFGGQNKVSNSTNFGFEIALSDNDLNKFSEKDANDNKAFAGKVNFEQQILNKDTSNLQMSITGDYSFVHKNFSAVDNYRNQEFTRDWNLSEMNNNVNENLIKFNVFFKKNELLKTKYSFDMFKQKNNYYGNRNSLSLNSQIKNLTLNGNINYLFSVDSINSTKYLKYDFDANYNLKYLKIGVKSLGENNIWKNTESDSLSVNSFYFNENEIYIKNIDSLKNKFYASYKHRDDFLPVNNIMKFSSSSENFKIGTEIIRNSNHTFKISVIYRKLSVPDTTFSENKPENTLTGRAEYFLRILKGAFSSSTFLEHGSGLENKKEFSYIEVQAGQGFFTWKDFNNNNIKELNEFMKAVYSDEANYLRVILPSNDYEKVYNQSFNQTVSINPRRLWRKEKWFKKFLTNFSDRFAFRLNRKIKETEKYYKINIADSGLMNLSYILRNNFTFRTLAGKMRFDYIYKKSTNKITSVNGTDNHKNTFNALNYNQYIKLFTFQNKFKIGIKEYYSVFFENNNYKTNYIENITKISAKINKNFSTSLNIEFNKKENKLNYEKLTSVNFGGELQYGKAQSSLLILKLNYINIDFSGSTNTSVAYEMLESLQPGKNYVWSVVWQKSLSSFLQLSVNYEGRKSNKNNIIHFGGMQLRALF